MLNIVLEFGLVTCLDFKSPLCNLKVFGRLKIYLHVPKYGADTNEDYDIHIKSKDDYIIVL